MRKLFFIAAASLAASVFGFTPTAYTNSYTEGGVTYVQRGALGTKDYVVTNVNSSAFVSGVSSVNSKTGAVVIVASDVQALPDNYTSLTNNSNFKAAVEKVSPPVVLPSKWALANVTNSMGGAVEATDIGAAGLSGVDDDFTVGGDLTVNGSLSAQNVKCDEGFWAYNWKYGDGSISKFGKDGLLYTVEFPSGGGTLALASDIQPIPSKWALANVTNASGGAVTAEDVEAVGTHGTTNRTFGWTADGSKVLFKNKVGSTMGFTDTGLKVGTTEIGFSQINTAGLNAGSVDNFIFGATPFKDYLKYGEWNTAYNKFLRKNDFPAEVKAVIYEDGTITNVAQILYAAGTNAAAKYQPKGAYATNASISNDFPIVTNAYTKAEVDDGFVPWVTDSEGNKTAVTIGSRPTLDSVNEWISTEQYYQNALVKKDDIIYICTVDCQSYVAPGSWESQADYWREVVVGAGSFAQGYINVAGLDSYAEGGYTHAEGNSTHAEGFSTHAEGFSTHAEGYSTHAEGNSTHAEGFSTHAEGYSTHAEGDYTHAEGDYTHAEGGYTHAEGGYTHAEGGYTHAEGNYTHAEGNSTHAEGFSTHAEGYSTHAEGNSTHAEGFSTHAEGYSTHAEGDYTHAEGDYTHAEGGYTHAEGGYTHAEGFSTHASTVATHAEGIKSEATNRTAYVWQGTDKGSDSFIDQDLVQKYGSHGPGTFNLNPVGGLAGFWVGETNLADHIDVRVTAATNAVASTIAPIATSAAEAVFVENADYALTNLTGAAVTLRSGEIGNLSLTSAQTSLALDLNFSAAADRSGDAILYLVNAADTELAVGPSASVTPIGYKASDKLKAGTNLVCVTRLAYSGGKSVVNVAIKEVK